MKTILLCSAFLMAGSILLPAQVGQDVKDLGHDTKTATEKGAHKTKTGAKKAYRTSTHAVKKGTHKAAAETEKGAGKVADKTETTTK